MITGVLETASKNIGKYFTSSKFNDSVTGDKLELQGIFEATTSEWEGVKSIQFYLFYQALVDGSTEKIKGKVDASTEKNDFLARFSGMSL